MHRPQIMHALEKKDVVNPNPYQYIIGKDGKEMAMFVKGS
jgi:hypothetical protein